MKIFVATETKSVKEFDWASYEEDLHYEEVFPNHDIHSSNASTYDSGVIIGKQSGPASQPNVVIADVTIENHSSKFWRYKRNESLIQNDENNGDSKHYFVEKENSSQDLISQEVYTYIQRPKRKLDDQWYESLDKIETVSCNVGDENSSSCLNVLEHAEVSIFSLYLYLYISIYLDNCNKLTRGS